MEFTIEIDCQLIVSLMNNQKKINQSIFEKSLTLYY